jgi:hypothetical protein
VKLVFSEDRQVFIADSSLLARVVALDNTAGLTSPALLGGGLLVRRTNLVSRERYGRWMSTFREDDTGVQRSFDDLASGLAGGTISRRRALKLAGASLLGAAGLLGVANPAQAATTPMCPVVVRGASGSVGTPENYATESG